MSSRPTAAERDFKVLESVRCLECGSPYAKPVGGGTTAANPGCPDCGYLGWLPFSSVAAAPLRLGSPAAPFRVTTLTPPK